jgi:transaldolase
MPALKALTDLGQSPWLDFIRRGFMDNGDLQSLIDRGLRGVTSNPSIFEKAIAHTDEYDSQIKQLIQSGASMREIYEALVFEDIRRACDLLLPVYEATAGLDGYVSLEVSPSLADDSEATKREVILFHEAVDRPNLMIKIPATEAGYPPIQEMIGRGININITLMFSLAQYEAVAEAYLSGLEQIKKNGGDLRSVASVASFFVSRVDTKVDRLLDEEGETDIRGDIGIANAKMAYQRLLEILDSERWKSLAAEGARPQRLLWGSTSTKDPAYPDTLYVDNLIGPHTVNTLPPETLDAYVDHGTAARTIDRELDSARASLARLRELGISLSTVTSELLEEGLESFSKAFDGLMRSIDTKCQSFRPQASAAAGD